MNMEWEASSTHVYVFSSSLGTVQSGCLGGLHCYGSKPSAQGPGSSSWALTFLISSCHFRMRMQGQCYFRLSRGRHELGTVVRLLLFPTIRWVHTTQSPDYEVMEMGSSELGLPSLQGQSPHNPTKWLLQKWLALSWFLSQVRSLHVTGRCWDLPGPSCWWLSSQAFLC